MKIKKRENKIRKILNIFGIVCLIFLIITSVYIFSRAIKSYFPVKHVVLTGNKHLTDDELKTLAGIDNNESLITISHREVGQRLIKSPWIKSVRMRKEFPETLSILVEETVPFALLDMNGHLFLIDEYGRLLEELKGDPIPFLPIIIGDPFKEREGFLEALHLAKVMNDMDFSSQKENVEIIISEPKELTTSINGTVVKVGAGEYVEKMKRLIELEDEIKRRDIPIDYIDMRFANRVVVKPIKEVVR